MLNITLAVLGVVSRVLNVAVHEHMLVQNANNVSIIGHIGVQIPCEIHQAGFARGEAENG